MSTPAPAPLLSIAFGSATDVGKRRENNEDSSRCGVLAGGTDQESTLLMVSDGVGGAKAGEVASKLAVDSLNRLLGDAGDPNGGGGAIDRRERLDTAIREVDRLIRAAAQQPGLAGMGATLSVLWIAGRDAWWGQAGDSRTYLLRAGELRQISHDQSPVGRLRASGQLTEEEARSHPYRHLIDQCLGGSGGTIEPETGKMAIEADDVYLLCSDGLSDGLWDHEIAAGMKLATENRSPEDVARALVAQANEASGKDNITAVVAHVRSSANAAGSTTDDAGGGVRRVLGWLGIGENPGAAQ